MDQVHDGGKYVGEAWLGYVDQEETQTCRVNRVYSLSDHGKIPLAPNDLEDCFQETPERGHLVTILADHIGETLQSDQSDLISPYRCLSMLRNIRHIKRFWGFEVVFEHSRH